MSFTVKVRSGITLNQLRLMSGVARLTDPELLALSETDPIIYPGASSEPGDRAVVSDGLFLSVDLAGKSFVGYRAKKSTRLLDLDLKNAYEVGDYWERVEPTSGKLILGAGEFYLLVSRERVRIPPDYAAEMAAWRRAGNFAPITPASSTLASATCPMARRGPPRFSRFGHTMSLLARARPETVQTHVRADASRPDELYGEEMIPVSAPGPRVGSTVLGRTDGRAPCRRLSSTSSVTRSPQSTHGTGPNRVPASYRKVPAWIEGHARRRPRARSPSRPRRSSPGRHSRAITGSGSVLVSGTRRAGLVDFARGPARGTPIRSARNCRPNARPWR